MMEKCHSQAEKPPTPKEHTKPIIFRLDICIQNLDDSAPKEYVELAKKIMSCSNQYLFGPVVTFRIERSMDQSYVATILSPTQKYPFPKTEPYKFKGPDYYTCIENSCFEKIVLDAFGFDRKILDHHYIGFI